MEIWKKRAALLAGVLLDMVPDLLAAAGAVCLTYGASLIYPPAGWLTGGALSILAAVIVSRGRGGG